MSRSRPKKTAPPPAPKAPPRAPKGKAPPVAKTTSPKAPVPALRLPMQPFYLGISMSGTVSAGAYTAGVLDFLIEALDAWYAERAKQQQQHGDDYGKWTIPPHELQLAVVTGASGGGMSGAIAAAALSQPFTAVREQSPGAGVPTNALFRAWVTDIDSKRLLSNDDLTSGGVTSLLDSSLIHEIAARAVRVGMPLPARRRWVRDGLRVLLTLTNLRGVPYAVEPQTQADSARTLNYADHRLFELLWSDSPSGGEAVPLRATGGPEWDSLAETAVATGAFPIALASKALSRFAREYNSRKSASAVDPLDATSDVSLKPIWDLADDAEFRTLNVDGGVTNNSPLEAARVELAKLPPSNPDVQDANHADRAVISIAPLTTSVPGKLPKFPDARITAIAGKIIAALVNQSRLQGEALNLTSDPRVATRWVISPTADGQTEPLASGLLGGFSGFFSKLFREHDYQLGRRNCQRFLTSYFGLPWTNPIVKQYGLSAKAQARLDAQYGFPAEYPSKDAQPVRFCPLIPVLPELRSEITVVRKPMDRKELADVLAMGFDRAKRVSKALLKESGYGTFSILAFTTSWPLIRAKIEGPLLDYVADELAKEDFVNQAKSNDMAQLIEEIRQLRGEITSVKKDLS